ncbi:MAG: hypothetical protein K0B11_17920 [Mariniphaga sp.]|nr:hypothetical protein [Mariniphaga sp.]
MNSKISHSTLDDGYDFFITDKWNKKHQYKISTFSLGIKQLSEAIEVVESEDQAVNTFQVLTDAATDIEQAELLLKAKIQRWINRRHLKVKHGKFEIIDDVLRGSLGWSDGFLDSYFKTVFEIDGKQITVEDFIELLAPYAGFKFKLQLYDPTDEMN